MIDINDIKKKYRKKLTVNKRWVYPAGGEDIQNLCTVIQQLETIIRNIQVNLSIDKQNEIERSILMIYR